jgi:phosphoribosyl-ATP pyrophosphohydrolase
MGDHVLDRLFQILQARKHADPERSYASSLYAQGTQKISEKIIEEAEETIAEALKGNADLLAAESADLLFHLMVLWADQGIVPGDVFAVLEKRFGTGGIEEKKLRKKS